MLRRLLAGVVTVAAVTFIPDLSASPTYYSRASISVTSITGNVTWTYGSPALPSLDLTAGVDQPHGIASKDDQIWAVYPFSATGPVEIEIEIKFTYGHEFKIAQGDYASATSSLMAFLNAAGQGSFGSFFAGAWQYYGWPEFAWKCGPAGTLKLTGPKSASCLMLGIGAWAYYDPPCGPVIPAPAAIGLGLLGWAMVGAVAKKLRGPA